MVKYIIGVFCFMVAVLLSIAPELTMLQASIVSGAGTLVGYILVKSFWSMYSLLGMFYLVWANRRRERSPKQKAVRKALFTLQEEFQKKEGRI